MHRVTYRSCKNFCTKVVVVKNDANAFDQIQTVRRDIIQTSNKWTHVSCASFCRHQCLACREDQRTVGLDAFVREVFQCFHTIFDHRDFDYDFLIQCSQFFPFFNHPFVICGNYFSTYITVHNCTNGFVVRFHICVSANAFFSHQ